MLTYGVLGIILLVLTLVSSLVLPTFWVKMIMLYAIAGFASLVLGAFFDDHIEDMLE